MEHRHFTSLVLIQAGKSGSLLKDFVGKYDQYSMAPECRGWLPQHGRTIVGAGLVPALKMAPSISFDNQVYILPNMAIKNLHLSAPSRPQQRATALCTPNYEWIPGISSCNKKSGYAILYTANNYFYPSNRITQESEHKQVAVTQIAQHIMLVKEEVVCFSGPPALSSLLHVLLLTSLPLV